MAQGKRPGPSTLSDTKTPAPAKVSVSGVGLLVQGTHRAYTLSLLLFLGSLALLLLGIVDIRRGLLFPLAEYYRVGAPSAIFHLDPRQLVLLLAGGAGAWWAYRRLLALEKSIRGGSLISLARLLGVAVLLLLVLDLFLYRGVAASRIGGAGEIRVGQTMPSAIFPSWAAPFQDGLNYLALVWHATFLAVLLGALFLTLVAGLERRWLSGKGLRSHIAGVALAAPMPFCSCCSAPMGAVLYRQGASLSGTLAFIVSSPMLNVTALLLAFLLLPWEFATLRLVSGVVVGVFVTYFVARLAVEKTAATQSDRGPRGVLLWVSQAVRLYARLFSFEQLMVARQADSPAALVAGWLSTAWRLSGVVVPVLLVGSVATAAIVSVIPSPENNLLGVVAAAAFGTLLMVPTWGEIPIANGLIQQGLTGPAATLLVTLPAVSAPCLAIIAGAVARATVAWLLALAVFLVGVSAGLVFVLL